MRLLNLYIVFDKKAKAVVGNVVHQVSPVPIIREITEAANKPGFIGNNPEDFEILHIGQLDEDTGALINPDDHSTNQVQIIAQVADLVKKH